MQLLIGLLFSVAVSSTFALTLKGHSVRQDPSLSISVVNTLVQSNHYGSPAPPWDPFSQVGWYFGDNPGFVDSNLPWLKDPNLCAVLAARPECIQCPKYTPKPKPTWTIPTKTTRSSKPSGKPTSTSSTIPSQPTTTPGHYRPVFLNLTAAIEAPDYLTYGLTDTIIQCEQMCDSVDGCNFINTYHDVNGKNGSLLLTCALYSQYHNASEATNTGGQTQPNGGVDSIADSDGFDKV